MGQYSEESLIAEATKVLGGEDPVLAAGIFGLKDLLGAATVGSAAGGLAGSAAGGDVGNVGGAVLGGIVAEQAYAASQGATLQLVVAVTGQRIHVLNRDDSGRLPEQLATFDRASCEVTVSKFGLSRIIELREPSTGEVLSLTGTTMPLSALAKGDQVVLHLLAA